MSVKLAIANDFLKAMVRLPQKVQSKVIEFVAKFQTEEKSTGLNYESITGARDKNLKSIRIDQDYRGILLKPDKGDIYLLLWVDHHDDAYSWARNRVCKINPETGSLQILLTKEHEQFPQPVVQDNIQKLPGLLDSYKDKELLKAGIPEEYLPSVRSLVSEEDLDTIAPKLPEETVDVLYQIAAGYSLQEILAEREIVSNVDTYDFAAALKQIDSLRRFVVIDDDIELHAILHAPLEQWRVFLHPSQRRIVERDFNGPVRVLGGAGTGKTVAAIHRAKWLLEKRYTENKARILFTTFTKNLAEDIEYNFLKLSSENKDRIIVVNLDKWVIDFLKEHKIPEKVHYFRGADDPFWNKALIEADSSANVPVSFYRDEWDQVIQPQAIMEIGEYASAPRIGRGTRINRKQRLAIWPVFESYRRILRENNLIEIEDAMRLAGQIIDKQGGISYQSVIVDEAQDMGTTALKLIRKIAGPERANDLFIVGDPFQSIYNKSVALTKCGINVRGRGKKLYINYRTTEEIRKRAICVLDGLNVDNLDSESDSLKGYTSILHGFNPQIVDCKSFDGEIDFISKYLQNAMDDSDRKISLKDICIISRTNSYLEKIEVKLYEKGVKTVNVTGNALDADREGVRLSTMHRAKGLEFDTVIISGLSADNDIPIVNEEDKVIEKQNDRRERSLLYVSMTRAKREVVMLYHGEKSRLI
jgi:hypothetical protein